MKPHEMLEFIRWLNCLNGTKLCEIFGDHLGMHFSEQYSENRIIRPMRLVCGLDNNNARLLCEAFNKHMEKWGVES
jgi:hypothetical protein